jgi:adenylate kinase
MNLIILGPQGSGKGTQAKLLAERLNLTHISTGALLREEAGRGTPKGNLIADLLKSGELLPFATVLDVLEGVLLESKNGFILDGTPRDLSQAEYLDSYLAERNITVDRVILLDIPREVSLDRLAKRAVLENRSDDTPAVIDERLADYQTKTLPVVDYYQQQGKLVTIDGSPDIQTIFNNILTKLTSLL